MSAFARNKLVRCLAARGLIGRQTIRRIFPKSKGFRVVGYAPSEAVDTYTEVANEFDCNGSPASLTDKFYAGDVFEISQDVDRVIEFQSGLSQSNIILIVNAEFDTGTATYYEVGKSQTLSALYPHTIRFPLPLPEPYKYTDAIASILGVDISTRGLAHFPNCR